MRKLMIILTCLGITQIAFGEESTAVELEWSTDAQSVQNVLYTILAAVTPVPAKKAFGSSVTAEADGGKYTLTEDDSGKYISCDSRPQKSKLKVGAAIQEYSCEFSDSVFYLQFGGLSQYLYDALFYFHKFRHRLASQVKVDGNENIILEDVKTILVCMPSGYKRSSIPWHTCSIAVK